MACKADPKRRRKKRIGKTGRESVFEITSLHLPPSRVGLMRRHRSEQQRNSSNMQFFLLFSFQDHSVNDRETSQEPKRRKDENGTSTSDVS